MYAESEWKHWCEAGDDESTGPVLEDSVKTQFFYAGLAKLVDDDHRVNSEVWLEPTPGHTPGHVSVHISLKGEEAIFTGDMIHHPCQIAFFPNGLPRLTMIRIGAEIREIDFWISMLISRC
ncbi:MAG: hypothetical protein CM1200mP24_07830 [Gammaproteobacteria bacterium]|nr:MAG: hypothetical protein CM1200mP24_07830 [Gammaproteobacteria bacterium]